MGRLSKVFSLVPKIFGRSRAKASQNSPLPRSQPTTTLPDSFRPAIQQTPTSPPAGSDRWTFLAIEGGYFPTKAEVNDFLRVISDPRYHGEIYFNVRAGTSVTDHCLYPSRFVWIQDGILYSQRAPALHERIRFTNDPVETHASLEELMLKFSKGKKLTANETIEPRQPPVTHQASEMCTNGSEVPPQIMDLLLQNKTVRFHRTIPGAGIYFIGTIWQEGSRFYAEIYQMNSERGGGHHAQSIDTDSMANLIAALPKA